MKILKIILIAVGSIIALVLIAGLFIKKEYVIEREIIINKPRQQVFDYIKYLRNQDNFSVWVMKDPAMKKNFRGTDGTVGFVYAWDGNKDAGKGEQEILSIEDGQKMDVEVRFEKPFEAIARTPFTTESVSGNQTKVRWGMHGKSPYPMNVMNVCMDNVLGKDIDKSLVNLKNILEK